jgi:putative spermidine/putrescine transport system permease protein
MKRRVDDTLTGLFAVVVVTAAAFLLVPLAMVVVMSFDVRESLGRFPPPGLSVRWYLAFFGDEHFMDGLKTSAVLAVIVASTSSVIGTLAAVFLDRARFPGRDTLAVYFLSPLVVPHLVLGFALLGFLSAVGVQAGFARLVAGHVMVTVPYAIRTALASFAGIRPSLTEAALSLGASERQAFWDVTVPLARTGIVAGWVFAFALSWDEVTLSLFLVDPFAFTLPTALFATMRDAFNLTVAAASVIMMATSALCIVVIDRVVGVDRVVGTGMYRV